MKTPLALGLVLASGALASPALVAERGVCGDNCYGQVRQNQLLGARSRPACKEAFQSTITPCTVTSTSSVSWAGYQYGYRPCGPSVTTRTDPATLTTATTTYTPLTILGRDRQPVPHCPPTTQSTTTVPTYFPYCKNVAQYSSACSCLGNTHSAITRPTPTVTSYHVGCSTQTITSFTTVATVYSTTETDTVTATAPTCSAVVTAYKNDGSGASKVYAMKYHGWGQVSDPDAPRYNADRDHPPDIEYLDAARDDCDAIQQCANMAYANTDEYYMFDLHYKEDDGWVCVQYYQGSGDSSNFDVADPDAHKVYGYQVAYYG